VANKQEQKLQLLQTQAIMFIQILTRTRKLRTDDEYKKRNEKAPGKHKQLQVQKKR
jgi:hypothetical protein